MRVLQQVIVTAVLAGAFSAPVAAFDASAPVPADSAVTIGKLPNGMTYYIRHNGWPENRVELRLAVRAGSLVEDDDQRGLAHFVEHMAFNGSQNFPPGELVHYFESIGARLGPDLNAYTSFDETVYRLEVPVDRESLLERGIVMLADFAARLSFVDSEITQERGVVLEEWRGHLGAGERMSRLVLPVLYQGSRYADRLPIGDPDVIRNAPPARLRDFYHAWYRPDLMAIVVVGDIDPEKVETLVRDQMGELPKKEGPQPPRLAIPPADTTRFVIATDPEARFSSIGLTIEEPREPLRTQGDYRTSFVRSLFAAMLNDRFRELSRIPDAPFLMASASFGILAPGTRSFGVRATVEDGGIEGGLRALVLELQRARVHGFGEAELDRARNSLMASLERSYQERARTESSRLIAQYVSNFLDDTPMPSIEQRLQLAREILPGISIDDTDAVLDTILVEGSRVVIAEAPEKEGLETPTTQELAWVIAEAESTPVTPWVDQVAGRSLLESEPTPGHVQERHEIPSIGVTVLKLDNGVDVWLRPTDFKRDQVLISGYSLGGASVVDPKRYPEADNALAIVREAGFGGFSPTEISKLLAGKLVAANPFIGDYTQGITASSTPGDLITALQLLYLEFTQVSDRPEVLEVVQKRLRTILANREQDPDAAFWDAVARVNSRDHYMAHPTTIEDVNALRFEPAVDFYRRCFDNAADFTFFCVGAFQVDSIVPLLDRYVGALPSKHKRTARFKDRHYRFPDRIEEVVVRKGREPRSRTALAFFADAGRDRAERTLVWSLTDLVEIRLRDILREELGSTYSVSVAYSDLQPVPKYGTIEIAFGGAPENADRMVEATLAEIQRLQREGPSESDLSTVQEIERRALETSEKRNGWWLGAMQHSHLLGLDPEGIATVRSRIDALTVDALHRAAKQYFPMKRWTRITLLPEGSAVGDSSSTTQPPPIGDK
jgi:zinc protease